MSQVTLKLFGAPQIFLGDRLLDLDHRKPVALLAYLAVTQQVHTRDDLATLFWPNAGSARTYLRNNLWIIKRSLGRAHADYLSISREDVAFKSTASLQVDVLQFCQAVAASCTEVDGDIVPPLMRAVELYTGEFLAGFTLRDSPAFDEWCFFQREELRRQLNRVLDLLVINYQSKADFTTALIFAQRRVHHEPTDEAAHRQLMALYAADGQQHAALRQFQQCLRILREELDVTPEPATQELLAMIKTRRFVPPAASSHTQEDTTSIQSVGQPKKQAMQYRVYAHDLIGRAAVLDEIQTLLQQPALQLLTLSGPGGVGKTSLAYATYMAQQSNFADGCYWVELAPTREPPFVAEAIAQALDLAQAKQMPIQTQLLDHLRAKSLLLILDNFEHVIAAAPFVAELVAHCPSLKVLITSREVLRLRCEYEYVVPPLPVPDKITDITAEQIGDSPAVQLFVKRVQQVRRDFVPDIGSLQSFAALCQRLDGLPLAIELAAAGCKLYSPEALLAQFVTQTTAALSLLHNGGRDMAARHQSLTATIAWSYKLLDATEQRFFRRAAYFVGGFTLEAATALCDGTQTVLARLRALVDKSLLQSFPHADPMPRFLMLETLREFGMAQLYDLQEIAPLAQQHAAYYVALATTIQLQLRGPHSARVARQFRLDYDNVRVAFRWLLSQKQLNDCLRLCHVLLDFWILGAPHEAAAYIAETLALVQDHPPTADYVNALVSAGFIAHSLENYGAERDYFERALALDLLLRQQGAAGGDTVKINTAIGLLGWVAFRRGEYTAALQRLDTALVHAQQANHTWSVAMTLMNIGNMHIRLGNHQQAAVALRKALCLHQEVGQYQGQASTLIHLSTFYVQEKRFGDAEEALAEGCALALAIAHQGAIASANLGYAQLAIARGQVDEARSRVNEALQIYRVLRLSGDAVKFTLLLMQIELATENTERVVMLGTALTTFLRAHDSQVTPNEQTLWHELYNTACQLLSPVAIKKAQSKGAAMTMADVVANVWDEV